MVYKCEVGLKYGSGLETDGESQHLVRTVKHSFSSLIKTFCGMQTQFQFGALVPWYLSTLVPSTLVPWYLGILVPWYLVYFTIGQNNKI